MADGTGIEWCDATWNPVTGCAVVSPGCTNCYAMRLAGTRLQHHRSRAGLTRNTKAGPVWTGEVRFNEQWLDQPLRWRRPRRIFVCAHGDLFAEGVPDGWIDRVFAVMALAPQHTFLVLTKRAARMREWAAWERSPTGIVREGMVRFWLDHWHATAKFGLDNSAWPKGRPTLQWPLPNVWLGVSVEDQQRADERIPHLLATPAAKRFISAEPLLGPVDLSQWIGVHHHPDNDPSHPAVQAIVRAARRQLGPTLDWVITGGESGPGARPMHPDWARSLRDQCAATGIPFFFKQWGEWAPVPHDDMLPGRPQHVRRGDLMLAPDGRSDVLAADLGTALEAVATPLRVVGKKAAGRMLDGREWSEFPR